MRIKKLMTGALAVVLSMSMLSGCGKKVTIDDILQKNQETSVEVARQLDEAVADEELTYDELKGLAANVPEGTYVIKMDAKGIMTMAKDGQSFDMSGEATADFDMQIDPTEFELGMKGEFSYGYEALGMSGSQGVEVGVYLVKEDDGHYAYTQLGDEMATREYLGNMEEAFSENLDLSEMMAEMDGMNFSEAVAESGSDIPFKEYMVLEEGTVDYEGTKCYVVTCSITGEQFVEEIRTNEDFQEAIAQSEMTFDEMLAEEITAGMTMEDIFNCMDLSYKYYYSTEDLSYVYTEMDLKPMVNKLVEVLAKALAEEEGIEITADVEKLEMSVGLIEGDVDVKFEGDYIEDEEDEDFMGGTSISEPTSNAEVALDIEFDKNAVLTFEDVNVIEADSHKTKFGELKVSEVLDWGFVDTDDKPVVDEDGYIYGYAKDICIFASSEGDLIQSIEIDFDDFNGSEKKNKVDVKFTKYGIMVGQSADVLKVLGEPTYSDIDEDEYYSWDDYSNKDSYSFSVRVEDGIITSVELYVYFD